MSVYPSKAHGLILVAVATLIGLALSGCGTAVATPALVTLTLAASSSAQPLAILLADGYHARYPYVTVTVEPVGSEDAARSYVEQGQADAALLVASPPVAFTEGLTGTRVASDALVITVNRENPLDNLGMAEARDVFTGRVRLWSELGPGHGAIQVLTREAGAGVRNILQQAVMGRRRFTPTAIVVPGNRKLLEELASDPLAIGFLPAGWLDDRVKALTLDGMSHEWVALNVPGYPAVLPIYLVTPDTPSPDVAAFAGFVQSDAGKQLLNGHYGLPPQSTP